MGREAKRAHYGPLTKTEIERENDDALISLTTIYYVQFHQSGGPLLNTTAF